MAQYNSPQGPRETEKMEPDGRSEKQGNQTDRTKMRKKSRHPERHETLGCDAKRNGQKRHGKNLEHPAGLLVSLIIK